MGKLTRGATKVDSGLSGNAPIESRESWTDIFTSGAETVYVRNANFLAQEAGFEYLVKKIKSP
jgi:hypothetical protein